MLQGVVLLICCGTAWCLDNGLGKTPPMGWLSWEKFRCNMDCEHDPKNCISEQLYKDHADIMASQGYKDAGYLYVNIDDCWMASERDTNGRLQPDLTRFPSGMNNLSDYIHSKGLKFGMYTAVGKETCQGFPASRDHWQVDADSFALWKVDSLKMDGCKEVSPAMDGWRLMSEALNKTGRSILYDCEWPLYQPNVNYTEVRKYCNLWRTGQDIQEAWVLIALTVDVYAANRGGFMDVAGPGGFNDPDMLLVGNAGLNLVQQRSMFAMWSLFPAPLFMSNDLRTISSEARDILLSRHVIDINQDSLGKSARRVYQRYMNTSSVEVWHRELSTGFAVCVFLRDLTRFGRSYDFSDRLSNMGVNKGNFTVYETFQWQKLGVFSSSSTISLHLEADEAKLLRLVPV